MTKSNREHERPEGHVAQPPKVNDAPEREPRHHESGEEPTRAVPPGTHDDEHQSEYGGGGVNGGA